MRLNVSGASFVQQWEKIGDRLEKNVRFASARALTVTARDASQDVTDALPSIFDRPNQFTRRGIAALPANTRTLQSAVLVKDSQAEYLGYQEEGGDRRPIPGKPVVLPINQRTNQFGNIPRGAIGKAKEKPSTFVASGTGRTKHLAPGIYERPAKGKRRDGGTGTTGALSHKAKGKATGGRMAKGSTGLKLLVSFKAKAAYKPKFDFRGRVVKSAQQNIAGNMRKSLADAVRTMRP